MQRARDRSRPSMRGCRESWRREGAQRTADGEDDAESSATGSGEAGDHPAADRRRSGAACSHSATTPATAKTAGVVLERKGQAEEHAGANHVAGVGRFALAQEQRPWPRSRPAAMNVSHCDAQPDAADRVNAGLDRSRKTSAATAPVPAGPAVRRADRAAAAMAAAAARSAAGTTASRAQTVRSAGVEEMDRRRLLIPRVAVREDRPRGSVRRRRRRAPDPRPWAGRATAGAAASSRSASDQSQPGIMRSCRRWVGKPKRLGYSAFEPHPCPPRPLPPASAVHHRSDLQRTRSARGSRRRGVCGVRRARRSTASSSSSTTTRRTAPARWPTSLRRGTASRSFTAAASSGSGRPSSRGSRRRGAPIVGVIDADLSHPPDLLPSMLLDHAAHVGRRRDRQPLHPGRRHEELAARPPAALPPGLRAGAWR